jgi:glycosyltransferase involved in cell wall biosynthesis
VCIEPENASALANAIISYYKNPKTGIMAGANGRRYVEEHFETRSIARSYLDAIRSVVHMQGLRAEPDFEPIKVD